MKEKKVTTKTVTLSPGGFFVKWEGGFYTFPRKEEQGTKDFGGKGVGRNLKIG